jgi:hypothetical protein
MVRVKRAKKRSQRYARGIHLIAPTKSEIEQAKSDALAKGFRTVWIHQKKMKKLRKVL